MSRLLHAIRSHGARSVLKLLLGVVLIALLLMRLDLHAVLEAFHRFSAGSILVTFALFVASWPIAAARWKLFAPRFPFRRLFELTMIGQFYSIVLPGQIAGEAVKAYRLAKGNADAERLAASVAMDRIVGMIALLLIAGIGMALTPHAVPGGLRALLLSICAALIIGLFGFRIPMLHAAALRLTDMIAALPQLRRFVPALQRLVHAWRDFAHMPARVFASLALACVFQLLALGTYATMASGLGVELPAADWAWIVAVASLAVLLPVSIGGLGLREGALVGCLSYLGVPGELAIALSLGLFAVMLSGAVVGGLVEMMAHVPDAQ
ncbi:lysylphosphatidylglycerol synthase transmembrane domain-containing protein [Rudaea sp.]|uniref:lysylphosphatidylglycerol synthase transmembrane domain-containing protein n=1 Tax=Rudaea sp. TaxID=2136325 RepID=UPI002ED2FD2E